MSGRLQSVAAGNVLLGGRFDCCALLRFISSQRPPLPVVSFAFCCALSLLLRFIAIAVLILSVNYSKGLVPPLPTHALGVPKFCCLCMFLMIFDCFWDFLVVDFLEGLFDWIFWSMSLAWQATSGWQNPQCRKPPGINKYHKKINTKSSKIN